MVLFLIMMILLVVYLITSTNMSKDKYISKDAPQIVGQDRWAVWSTYADGKCSKEVFPTILTYTNAVRLNYCARKYTRSTKYMLGPTNDTLVMEEYEGEDCIANQISRTTLDFSVCQRNSQSYFVKSLRVLNSVNLDPKNPTYRYSRNRRLKSQSNQTEKWKLQKRKMKQQI